MGGCELNAERRAHRSEGRTAPGRSTSTASLVGNDQEANPTARGPMALFASVPPQHTSSVTCGLKRSNFPGGLRILGPAKKTVSSGLYNDLQVSRPPHLGLSWVGWVGLKTQARFPRGVVQRYNRVRLSRVHVCFKMC